MYYGILYYKAFRTSQCESIIKNSFSKLELKLTDVRASATKSTFANMMSTLFVNNNIVVVVSGYRDNEEVIYMISNAINIEREVASFCLKDGTHSYAVMCETQTIIILPDEPKLIEESLNQINM